MKTLSDAASGRNGFGDVETVEESKECMTLFVEQQRSNMTGMQFLLAAWKLFPLSEFCSRFMTPTMLPFGFRCKKAMVV